MILCFFQRERRRRRRRKKLKHDINFTQSCNVIYHNAPERISVTKLQHQQALLDRSEIELYFLYRISGTRNLHFVRVQPLYCSITRFPKRKYRGSRPSKSDPLPPAGKIWWSYRTLAQSLPKVGSLVVSCYSLD